MAQAALVELKNKRLLQMPNRLFKNRNYNWILDIYDRPTEVSKLGLTYQYRIAILATNEFYPQMKFAEDVYKIEVSISEYLPRRSLQWNLFQINGAR